jgi:cation:H+ antiporter
MIPEWWSTWSIPVVVLLFAGSAIVIALAGTRITRIADRLADLTGLGEAIFGAVLLGGTTSAAGIVTSVSSAMQGYPELAISNAIGGIAAQTVFLAVADIAYRQANLEHAAASVENLMQGALLSTMLAIPLLAMAGPEVSVYGVNPASLALCGAYLFGLRLVAQAKSTPYWQPRQTTETRQDEPDEEVTASTSLVSIWLRFTGLAVVVGLAGFLVAETGIEIADRTGISETVVGGLFTAVSTSLPELVTSVAAVRRGALTLAVGGIIGGNSFDVLFVAFGDLAFREGSIYHAITEQQIFIVALTLLLTGILMLGLLRREKQGIMGIGFESFLVLILYFSAFGLLVFQ